MTRHIRLTRRKDGCAIIRINGKTIVVPPVDTPTPAEKKLKRLILAAITLKRDLDFLLGKGLDEWRLLMFLTMAARADIVAQKLGSTYTFRLPAGREIKANVQRLQKVANWIERWFNRSSLPSKSVGGLSELRKLPETITSLAEYLATCVKRMRSANRFRDDPSGLEREAWKQLRLHSFCYRLLLPATSNKAAERGPQDRGKRRDYGTRILGQATSGEATQHGCCA